MNALRSAGGDITWHEAQQDLDKELAEEFTPADVEREQQLWAMGLRN